MCTEIYIAPTSADVDLTVPVDPDKPALWIGPLAPGDHHARKTLEQDRLFEVGSFLGCSCGLAFGNWSQKNPEEEHERRVADVLALRKILEANRDSIDCILCVDYEYHEDRDLYDRRILDLELMHPDNPDFCLEHDTVYEIWPEGIPGPARLEKVFPPTSLRAEQIGGIAPELDGYQRDFSDKAWTDIKQETYEYHSDAFTLMDHETLRHFLPGFLLASISDPGDLGFYFMRFAMRDDYVDFYRILDPNQRRFLIAGTDFLLRPMILDSEEAGAVAQVRERCLALGR